MPRYAKSNVTIDDLKEKILSLAGVEDIRDAVVELSCNFPSVVMKDLSKVNFDMENIAFVGEFNMPGTEDLEPFEMIGSFPVAWIVSGGDWEQPLVFVLYIGDKGELRAYIPKDGNAYNHKEKCAYGSEEDEVEFNEEDYVFDSAALRADVMKRIQVKE